MKKIEEILQNMEGKNGTLTPLGEKITKMIAVGLVVVVLLFVLIIASSIGMFNWLELKIRVLTGLDSFLAKGLSFLVLAVFFGTPLSGFTWSLLPIPQKNKKRKRFIFLSFLALSFFISYFTSKNVYFNPENGKPLKYFSIGVNGEYNFSNSDGYDPITGDKLQQVDKATIIQYLKGSKSGNIDVVNVGESALIGLEKNARFYPVDFKNKTERNLYLCITFKDALDGGVIIQRIAAKQRIRLSLMEGKHYFGYIDNNGTTYGGRSDHFFLKRQTILTPSAYYFDVLIDKQLYNLSKTFCLDVLVSDNQKVTLKERSVLHNKELDGKQELWIMFLIGVPIFSSLLFLWARFGEDLGK